jgi:hypothetical protein
MNDKISPTIEVANAVFKPSNKDGILSVILLVSKSCKPKKIPTKVPKTPIVVKTPGIASYRYGLTASRLFDRFNLSIHRIDNTPHATNRE